MSVLAVMPTLQEQRRKRKRRAYLHPKTFSHILSSFIPSPDGKCRLFQAVMHPIENLDSVMILFFSV
jgi:hypothetical protein